ncbi:TIGR01244 family sulfur transferase [Albimonas sp. CAU 1670]|uniref:bifunctional protein tyrosine phosphatase family protein/NAD(P)/FAD-dependent oxidoreductase n=1 Tax=Albimonas sp. CAU 1670 TaxID=3032599 RepID=UPI0023DC2D08|nr:bifunctional protein tyrosine phosphatase family protein/NAD(P)/FAD-dependent oxidoreductase [Albimonas sp. CAU 1670]MDF2234579.1 TIGR01244 family sulfur transferase [Albimonas sp. CAU 1670]
MERKIVSPEFSVSPQIDPADVGLAAAQGVRAIVCNRPDGEGDQPSSETIREEAERLGLEFRYLPVPSGQVTDEAARGFGKALETLPGPVLAYCRSGTRSMTLWALAKAPRLSPDAIVAAAQGAGYDLDGLRPRLEAAARLGEANKPDASGPGAPPAHRYDVVIVGGGAGGIAAAASLLKRRPRLDIAIVEPQSIHNYQPGWTLVGGGVFDRRDTLKPMASVMPAGVHWIRAAAAQFSPERREISLEDGARLAYRALVVAPGLKLDWDAIPGLKETLGRNGVTSNYLFGMAPYTWELVQTLREGRAIFTQPPMPIKCAGAPQKAMYLACDHWNREGRLGRLDIQFCNAGGVLFGVEDYVPALMNYVNAYGIKLAMNETLVSVDGEAKTAVFSRKTDAGTEEVTKAFDMLHAVPPQRGHDFIARSPLANAAGWVEVDPATLRHVHFADVYGLGDACSAPNAKTAAAVRKQAPVVAENVIATLEGGEPRAIYDGYGSCPLTVERGKIVLAEFGYGGKLLPSFPDWLIDGKQPTRAAWFLKEKLLPPVYWHAMLKGREWLAAPEILPRTPTPHAAGKALAETAGKAG